MHYPWTRGSTKQCSDWKNYITKVIDSSVQTINFDCAVAVKPSNEQIDKFREGLAQDFGENLKINTRHFEAVSCLIESKGIPTVAASGQFLRFIGKEGTWDLDMGKDTFADWKVIPFKERKEPVILPSISLTIEEVNPYFEREE